MKSEFYVNQAIMWREDIRNFIFSLLGLNPNIIDNPFDIVTELSDESVLSDYARKLNCSNNDVFNTIYNKVSEAMGLKQKAKSAGINLHAYNILGLLNNQSFMDTLSEIFQCGNEIKEITEKLLDMHKIQNFSLSAGFITDSEKDLPYSKLLWRFLHPNNINRIKSFYGEEFNTWDIINEFTSDYAKEILSRYYHCAPHEIYAHLILDSTGSTFNTPPVKSHIQDNSQTFDSFAIAKMMETFKAIGNRYLAEAGDIASNIWKNICLPDTLRLILPLYQYYVLRHYRDFVRNMLELKTPVKNLPIKADIISDFIYSDNTNIGIHAIIDENQSLLIQYSIEYNDNIRSDLLSIKGEDNMLQYLRDILPGNARDLNSNDRILAERIINHEIAPPSCPERGIWALMNEHKDLSLVQALALNTIRINDPYNITDMIKDNNENEIMNLDETVITRYDPPEQIFNNIKKMYEDSGIIPKIIE